MSPETRKNGVCSKKGMLPSFNDQAGELVDVEEISEENKSKPKALWLRGGRRPDTQDREGGRR